jgi:hypothetical protein
VGEMGKVLVRKNRLKAEKDTQKQESLWKEEQALRRQVGIQSIMIISAFIFAFFVLPFISAILTANSIKAGGTPVDLRYRSFSGSAGQVTEPDLRLIGATQRDVFFYDDDHNRTIVVPQAEIVSIEVPDENPE